MGAFAQDIADLGGIMLTVTRAATATEADSKGRVQTGATTTVTVLAAIQPIAGMSDVVRLPEGLRTRELRKLYSDAELRTADESTGLLGDRFSLDGRTWEVQMVERWGDFWKAIAAQVPA